MTTRRSSPTAERRHLVLDPCTLGRPFHLLEEFNQRLGRQLERHVNTRFNLRHGASFAVAHVTIGTYAGDAAWRSYSTPAGLLAVRLERRLLLAMLGYHYGDKGTVNIDEHAPETETEQRFGVATGLALLDVLRTCVATPAEGGFTPQPLRTPATGDRVIRVEIREHVLGLSGLLEIALDDAWMAAIFASAAPRRTTSAQSAKAETPLAERLPVTLSVRMLSKNVLLDELLQLSPGDVMPVRLPGTAEVLVGDTRLFQAAVAEHGGTLCLTSFETTE